MELAAGCAKGVLAETSVRLCSILGGDTGAISALRILHLYMERLGCDFQVPFGGPLGLPYGRTATFIALWSARFVARAYTLYIIPLSSPFPAPCASLSGAQAAQA